MMMAGRRMVLIRRPLLQQQLERRFLNLSASAAAVPAVLHHLVRLVVLLLLLSIDFSSDAAAANAAFIVPSSQSIVSSLPFRQQRRRKYPQTNQQLPPSRWTTTSRLHNDVSQSRTMTTTTATNNKLPGTAQLDKAWEDLGFEFRKTNSHVEIQYQDGKWGKPELVSEPYVNLHIGATALHYGQACFEGLKAFCHDDNTVHVFRPEENAARMQTSCRRILMPELPTKLFLEAIDAVVRDNLEYVPPYGSNGALYIRPLLFGSGPRIGLQPADAYTFLILVIPVGDYYAGGLAQPVDGQLITEYDRAAPRGVGSVKVAGNYAADLLPNQESKKSGFPIVLYVDAATQTKIEEFSTSNFVGIDNDRKLYVTPKSPSVLPSITNKSLMEVAAKDLGYTVEARDIFLDELETFDEVLAVGTAVVVTPVGSITTPDNKVYEFGQHEIGPFTRQLYDRVRAIQNGQVEDTYGWNYQVEY